MPLSSRRVEQQGYIHSCLGIMNLHEKYEALMNQAYQQALTYPLHPSYKTVKNILTMLENKKLDEKPTPKAHGLTRGAAYYGRKQHE